MGFRAPGLTQEALQHEMGMLDPASTLEIKAGNDVMNPNKKCVLRTQTLEAFWSYPMEQRMSPLLGVWNKGV